MGLPEAVKGRIEAEANRLFALLGPPPKGTAQDPPVRMAGEIHTEKLGAKDVSQFRYVTQVDPLGRTIEKYFPFKGGWMGLGVEGYATLVELAKELASFPGLRGRVSTTFVEDSLFGWMFGRLSGKHGKDLGAIAYIEDETRKAVTSYKFWFPIENLRIQAPFAIAGAKFQVFPTALLDRIETEWKAAKADLAAKIDLAMKNHRRKLQGRVCCVVEVEGERQIARDRARELVDDVLMALRLFSPTAFVPEMASYVGRTGTVLVPGTEGYLETAGGGAFISADEDMRMREWPISEQLVAELRGAGLDSVGALVGKSEDERSRLEQRCMTALQLLDKSIRSNDLLDKTVFALAAAESLVLRDPFEPIVGSASLRLAVMAEDSPERRIQAVRHVKRAHSIRSAYLHHGRRDEDLDCIRELVNLVRVALLRATDWTRQFGTPEEMAEHLEAVLLRSDAEPATH